MVAFALVCWAVGIAWSKLWPGPPEAALIQVIAGVCFGLLYSSVLPFLGRGPALRPRPVRHWASLGLLLCHGLVLIMAGRHVALCSVHLRSTVAERPLLISWQAVVEKAEMMQGGIRLTCFVADLGDSGGSWAEGSGGCHQIGEVTPRALGEKVSLEISENIYRSIAAELPLPGDCFAVRSLLQPVRCSPFDESWEAALLRQGVRYRSQIKYPAHLQVLRVPRLPLGLYLRRWLEVGLRRVEERLGRVWGSESLAVGMALTFGRRALLSRRLARQWKDSGTYHLTSVSGLHMVFVGGLLASICRFARLPRWLGLVGAACVGGGYVFTAGARPGAVRAYLMMLFGWGARLRFKAVEPPQVFCLVAALVLVCSPLSLFDPGFQLSYVTVLGLLMLRPLLISLRELRHGLFWQPLAVAVGAQMSNAPLLARYNHGRWFVLACLVNALIVPVSAAVVFSVLLAVPLLVTPFPLPGTVWLLQVLELPSWVLRHLLRLVGRLPLVSVVAGVPSWPVVLVYYLLVWGLGRWVLPRGALGLRVLVAVLGRWWRRYRQCSSVIVFVVACGLLVLCMLLPGREGPWLCFLDVGHGDACLIGAAGLKVLVDCGPIYSERHIDEDAFSSLLSSSSPQVFERRLQQYRAPLLDALRRYRINRLDAVLITHLHADHYGGLLVLLPRRMVRTIYWHGAVSPVSEQLQRISGWYGVSWFGLQEGTVVKLGDSLRIDVLQNLAASPPRAGKGGVQSIGQGNLLARATADLQKMEGPTVDMVGACPLLSEESQGSPMNPLETQRSFFEKLSENDFSLVLSVMVPGTQDQILLTGDIETAGRAALLQESLGAPDCVGCPPGSEENQGCPLHCSDVASSRLGVVDWATQHTGLPNYGPPDRRATSGQEGNVSPIFEETKRTTWLVKVPHHGSYTALDPYLWKTLKPEVAVISVGNGKDVDGRLLAMLQMIAARIHLTNEDGDLLVRYNSDGWSLGLGE